MTKPNISITTNNIYSIRGQQVMLDSDLALLYKVETKRMNETIKRNINRFPPEFMFQLTTAEWENLKFQIGTSSSNLRSQIATSSYGGRRYLPFVFTEHGVIMLSGVLNSDIANQINIAVVKAFVEMRRAVSKPLAKKIDDIEKYLLLHIDSTNYHLDDHTEKINALIEKLNEMTRTPPAPKRKIGFIQ